MKKDIVKVLLETKEAVEIICARNSFLLIGLVVNQCLASESEVGLSYHKKLS